jgi:hypothetical protein
MPKGPRGEERPGDVIGAAIMVGKIARARSMTTLPRPTMRGAVRRVVRRGRRS